jgi:hypothetical protein
MLAYVPIASALGVLPIVGPTFICFVEILGTARILSAAHLYASLMPDEVGASPTYLLLHYFLATCLSRFSVLSAGFEAMRGCCPWPSLFPHLKMLRVPPASAHLLEKLGVATAFTLIDDELACEPQSIPQQLLIPSGKGLKLLDLCPVHDDDSVAESESETGNTRRQRGKSFDSDSESEEGTSNAQMSIRRKVLSRRMRRRNRLNYIEAKEETSTQHDGSRFDVQFEDPNWWQYLPSLKCIGLACLVLDDCLTEESTEHEDTTSHGKFATLPRREIAAKAAHSSLARLICSERRSTQLLSLAECIGFSVKENKFGARGDLSPFAERRRLHVLSNRLFKERLLLDAHERSSEQSRWWGLLRPDATSVIVQDSRTKACQLLSVGDPRVVCSLCNEAWQGEISTILPLAAADRQTIIETTNNWKLADLDVAAFSYTPVPHTLESRLTTNPGTHVSTHSMGALLGSTVQLNLALQFYLLDNTDESTPAPKDKGVPNEWSFVGSQIFLGVLGSLVVPRREIRKLLGELSDAGVRFVYFSPRNMRRQKELAIQMGIDVAWNCAISLRPLESGEDDPHRMMSTYADWDKNAKLPHGVDDVRKHLDEVDNGKCHVLTRS